MKTAILMAFAATLAFPVLAQDATQRVEPRTPSVGTTASAQPAQKSAVTPRETARIAKAQNKDTKCATKEKQQRQKKATAT
jgi:hypothetical protein